MNKDDFDLLHQFKREHISNSSLDLFSGLADRCFGFVRKNVRSKESIELFAEEEFIRKKDFSEMRCEMPGIPRSTFLMVFSPDGSRVASTHGNHNIYITDLRNGKNIKTLVGHPRTPWCIAFHPTSDQIVASGCLGGQVRIWDLSGGSEVWTAVNQTVIASLAFHPNDRVLAIATYNCVYFWDWSKPEPFVSAATYNVKEKVRYVSFDSLGHKLITGIANSPTTRWERVRAPVPVPRQEWCASPYRRRITQRLASGNQNQFQPSTTENTASPPRDTLLSFPERERRISMCYRTLVREYEQLVHRYLQLYRSPTMIDRGTDPMEPDLWFNNSGTQTSEPQAGSSGGGTPTPAPTKSAAESVLDETLPSTSGSQRAGSVEETTTQEPTPSTSSQSPSKSAYNLLTPSRIFSVIKKTKTLIRGTQTPESRKHKTDDAEEPKEKRFKKSNGSKTKSSKKSNKDGRTNSTQTDQNQNQNQQATPRKVMSLNAQKAPHSDTSSSSSEFRVRSHDEATTMNAPGPSGLQRQESTDTAESGGLRRQESTETEEEMSAGPSTSSTGRRDANSNQANVDELLSNIKRTAEEEVRNRILPIIRSLPATDRPELIRLFENSREHVRMRFRQMYPSFMRKTNRRHLNLADTTSDSSSSEEDANANNQSFRHNSNGSPSGGQLANQPAANACSELERLVTLLTDIDEEGTDRGAQTSQTNRDRDTGESIESSNPTVDIPDSTSQETTVPTRRTLLDDWSQDYLNQSASPSPRDSNFQPPATVANTHTRTTNSTIYTSNTTAPRRRWFSHRISAFMPTRVNYIRHRRMPHYLWGRSRLNTRPYGNSTFGVDELFNYSELDNSEDDPPPPPPPPDADHPEVPTTSTSESSISDMYTNIVRELESSLENVMRMRVSTRPGETSNMLSSFSERLESILSQSDAILRNLSNSMDVLSSNTPPMRSSTPEPSTSSSWNVFDRSPYFDLRDQRSDNPTLSPYNTQPDIINLGDLFDFGQRPSYNAVASDHTYPRNPEDAHHLPPISEAGTPMVATIHLTIMHIQRQARLLRQQVENIERIDRAMLEVEQLQLTRRLIVELIRHVSDLDSNAPGNEGSSRTSVAGVTSVRQMMAGTRISDSSPHESGTEDGTPGRSSSWNYNREGSGSGENGGGDAPSRSDNARSGEGTSSGQATQGRSRTGGRKTYPPSRMCRSTANSSATQEPPSSGGRYQQAFSSYSVINSNTLTLMTRRLEQLLTEEMAAFTTTGQGRPGSRSTATIDLGEHILSLRLHGCVLRMNRVLGNGVGSSWIGNYRADPTAAVTQDGVSRYSARHTLSLIIDSMTRHVEELGNSPVPQGSQMHAVLAMSLLLTELMLLVVVDSIPPPTGVNLTNERVSLTCRIDRLCGQMLQTRQCTYSHQLTRSLRLMKMTMRHAQSALGQTYHARRSTLIPRHNTDRRMLLGSINRCLRTIRRQRHADVLNTTGNQDGMGQEASNDNAATSTPLNNTDWYSSVSDLIAQISTSNNEEESSIADPQPSTSRSFMPPGPHNDVSSNNDNSDDDDDDTDAYSIGGGSNLYRTSNINLSPGGEQGSSNSISPPVTLQSRPWNVPSVQVNDVPVSDINAIRQRLLNQRSRFAERVAELRSNSQMGGLFRPRFLHPLYATVNPFDADLDDSQREQIYDSDMITTVTPNHRIQAWDVSDWSVPNIGSPTRNLVVGECKIHNDASVDIAKDGTILVTLLPSGGYLNVTNRLGVYSLKWETLGQCLYTTSFEQNAVSVSLSPLSRHLVVGLASRIVPSDRWIMARVFKIHQKDEPGDRLPVIRELEQNRDSRINCIRWLPTSGQGLIYATNTGQLVVLT
ncbi:unnamed protein product [Psylliodes chrysocephalus]|uniref:Activating molecule in BECN1-regulated autophagy protein 1 n=1 Tax=Psylliodes chrysocephalus TaxID=3402493 RepID=A0A9P0GCA2_9CUCU|nr:unnamed protein product [Psylliodes chrysocephala]